MNASYSDLFDYRIRCLCARIRSYQVLKKCMSRNNTKCAPENIPAVIIELDMKMRKLLTDLDFRCSIQLRDL